MHTAESDSTVGCTPRSFWSFSSLDSAVGCTPWSFWRTFHHLTPRWNAHRGVFFKNLNILTKLKPNSKILQPVYQGPRWVRIMKKTGGRKSRDTLPLIKFNLLLPWYGIVLANTRPCPPARHHYTAVHKACFYMVMLPVRWWRFGSILNEDVLRHSSLSYLGMFFFLWLYSVHIEEGGGQKPRQRSQRLIGGPNLFNFLPRKQFCFSLFGRNS